jgi:cbb3-type cytochrome c oxidase subunit III
VNIRLACCTLALLATAAALPAAQARGSVEAGAALAATCAACHGAAGANSNNPEWPNLAGQNASYITRQLHLLHDGKRVGKPGDANAATMSAMALTLTDQNMEDVAAYFATLAPAGLEADPAHWQAGQKLYQWGDRARGIPSCSACHGPVGAGNPTGGYPSLRAQQSAYVVKQLNAYGSDERYTRNDKGATNGGELAAIMRTVAGRLSEDDKRNLAAYIQGMR